MPDTPLPPAMARAGFTAVHDNTEGARVAVPTALIAQFFGEELQQFLANKKKETLDKEK